MREQAKPESRVAHDDPWSVVAVDELDIANRDRIEQMSHANILALHVALGDNLVLLPSGWLAELQAWHIRAAIWYGMAGSVSGSRC